MLKFEEQARTSTAPMVAVIGKDTAKLGFDVDRPCAVKRKMKLRVRLESQLDIQPGDTDLREHTRNGEEARRTDRLEVR